VSEYYFDEDKAYNNSMQGAAVWLRMSVRYINIFELLRRLRVKLSRPMP
jgi:hypothetical protein